MSPAAACVGAVRAGAAFGRRAASGSLAGWNQKKGNCAPVCADPVDLQGRLGRGALGSLALGREQEGPSDSPSSKRSVEIADATDSNQALAESFGSAGGSTVRAVPT